MKIMPYSSIQRYTTVEIMGQKVLKCDRSGKGCDAQNAAIAIPKDIIGREFEIRKTHSGTLSLQGASRPELSRSF